MIRRSDTHPVRSIRNDDALLNLRNHRSALAWRLFLLAAAAVVLPSSFLRASTVTWDASTTGTGSDGGGTWSNAGASNWAGGSGDVPWNNSDNNDNAVFGVGGTPGTVTVSGGVDVGNITFNPVASGTYYTIAGSTITLTSGTITTNAASATISSQLAGSAGLTVSGTGTLTLSNASNSYTGGTTLTSGTLNLGSTTALSSGTLTLSGGTLLDTLGSAISNNVNVTASTTTTLAGGGGASFMLLSGVITGSGTIQTDTGGDNIRLSGNNSGFTGTFISQTGNGGVYLNSANSASAAALWQVNGTVISNTVGTFNFGSLAGAGSLQAGNGAAVFSIGALNQNTTFSGSINNNGGTASLIKVGTGNLTLSGNSNYSGGTTLSSGTLSIGNANALGSGTLTLSGGTVVDTLGSAVANNVNVTASTTNTLISGVGGSFMQLSGSISGSGTLQTDAAGDNIRLSGNNSGFSGTFIDGVLIFLINANTTSAAAVWQLNSTGVLGASAAGTYNLGSLSGSGQLQASSGADVFSIGALNQNTTFSGTIINSGGTGSLIKVGTGSLTLSGNNNYSGGTTLSSGTLSLGSTTALGSSTLTLSGGTVVDTLGSAVANNVNVTASTTNTLISGAGASFMQLSGSISGSGTLQTDAAGDNIRLSGNNSGFSGTFIDGVLLFLIGPNSTSAAAAWQTNSTGALAANGAGTYNLGSISGSGQLQASSGADVFSIGALNQNTTFSGTIVNSGGVGSVIETGTGTLILTGANTYSGGTTINSGGTLQIGNGGTAGSLLSTGTITDNGSLVYDYNSSGSVTITGSNISGSGNLSATAVDIALSGTIAVGGSQSYTEVGGGGAGQGISLGILATSGTTTLSGSSITLAGDVGNGALALNTSATNGPISLNISLGRSGVFNAPANVIANSGTGTISIVGSGPVSTGWSCPVTLTGAVNISAPLADSSTLTINPTTATASSASAILSGGMSLVVGGPGTLALTAANTYSGSTTINAGTLQIGNGGTTGSISSTTGVSGSSGATLAFDQSGSVAWSKATSGGLGITQAGSGTLTLSGAGLTYTGPTTAASGTLIVAGGISGNVAANGGMLLANSTVGGSGSVNGGILGGAGTIAGNVVVGTGSGAASSSIIDPSAGGALAGTIFNIGGNLSLNSDAAYEFQLNADENFVSDGMAVTGTLTLGTGATLIGFNAGSGTSPLDIGDQYLIASYRTLVGTFANAPATGDTFMIGIDTYSINYNYSGDNEIELTLTAVPEPGTWATILGGLAMLSVYQRRRRSRSRL